MNVVTVSELLERSDDYIGQVVELEGELKLAGSVALMKADDAQWKIRGDNKTVFIDLDEDEFYKMLLGFYAKGRKYEVRWGLYQFQVRLRGRVEILNYDPIPLMLTDINYVRADDGYRSYMLEFGYGDRYIYEAFVAPAEKKNSFTKNVRSRVSIPLQSDTDYDIDLSEYNETLESIIGKVVKVQGEVHKARIKKRSHSNIPLALLTTNLSALGAKSNWIWIAYDNYFEIFHLIAARKIMEGGSIQPPLYTESEFVGRLSYIPANQESPMIVNNPPNLMLEDLRFVWFEEKTITKKELTRFAKID